MRTQVRDLSGFDIKALSRLSMRESRIYKYIRNIYFNVTLSARVRGVTKCFHISENWGKMKMEIERHKSITNRKRWKNVAIWCDV